MPASRIWQPWIGLWRGQLVENGRADHHRVIYGLLPQPQQFVPAVDKKLVFQDRPTNIASALIPQKIRRRSSASVIEPIVGCPRVRAVVPEALAVPVVRSLRSDDA